MLALLLSIAGMLVSGVLLQHHLAITAGRTGVLAGFCSVGKNSSCDAVLGSDWAYFPRHQIGRLQPVPTALWGFLFFGAIFSWYAAVGVPGVDRRMWHLPPLIATAAATGICAGLAFIMYTRLPDWCPLCAVTHATAALLFIATALLWPRRRTARPSTNREEGSAGVEKAAVNDAHHVVSVTRERPVNWTFLISPARQAILAMLLAVSIGWAASSEFYKQLNARNAADVRVRLDKYESDLKMVYNRYMSEPAVNIPVGPEDSILGPANAAHTVVLFQDLQCDFCRMVHAKLEAKVAEFPGRLRVVFKHFPMNRDCNEYVTSKTHPAACAAALTAEGARLLGGEEMFQKMSDELFGKRDTFGRKPKEFLTQACAKLGLNENELWGKIRSAQALERIKSHTWQAHQAKVEAVPALFLDGRPLNPFVLDKFWDFVLPDPAQKRAPATRAAATRSE